MKLVDQLIAAAVVSFSAIMGCSSSCPEDVPLFSDDPEGVHQWYLPALGAIEAWRVERGDPESVIAVIDNGYDLTHPDLEGQLWTNDDELENGVDDDGNGYIDDVHGWDFLDGDPDAGIAVDIEVDPSLRGHGTAIAGVIAAETDNGIGIAGACPACRLMLLRGRDFVNAHNVMPLLAEAIRYAVQNGARVISISDGVFEDSLDEETSADIESALFEAEAAGVVVVASAGNDGPGILRFPAIVDSVVAVAAVNAEMGPTQWTGTGPEVDVSAPGECVFSTRPGGEYGYFQGTSASAPIVAGLAGLLVSSHPDWQAAQIVERLRGTASPTSQDGLGAGVIDFAAALGD